MRKDWIDVKRLSALSIVVLFVACFVAAEVAYNVAVVALHPLTLPAMQHLLVATNLGIALPSAIAVAFWARAHLIPIRQLRPYMRGVEARFQELENAFWQRY